MQWRLFSDTVFRWGAEVELAFGQKHVIVQKHMKWLCIFLFRSVCSAEYFHTVHLATCSWTRPAGEITTSSLWVWGSPSVPFPFSLSWEINSLVLGQSSKRLISCLCFKKNKTNKTTTTIKTQPVYEEALVFWKHPKSLKCCFPIFLLSKWLQFEFCHSKIHFLSVVLPILTLSHSRACQVIVWVSWER